MIVVPGKGLAERTDAIFFCGLKFPFGLVAHVFGFGTLGIQGLYYINGFGVH
jgi:hypothetical protein